MVSPGPVTSSRKLVNVRRTRETKRASYTPTDCAKGRIRPCITKRMHFMHWKVHKIIRKRKIILDIQQITTIILKVHT